jgi:hypothetical protein
MNTPLLPDAEPARTYAVVLTSDPNGAPLVLSQDDIDHLIDLVQENGVPDEPGTIDFGTLTASDAGPVLYHGAALSDDDAAVLVSTGLAIVIQSALDALGRPTNSGDSQ